MNNTVGILTFHRALNYGANLQAYALQNYLFALDIDNEIVDYRCQYMIDRYQKTIRKTNGNKLRGLAWSLMTAGSVKQKKRCTEQFAQRFLKLSRSYDSSTIAEASDRYAAFISGSDQVWSPTCVGFDPVYFLTFTQHEKKFSYAASIAAQEIPAAIREEYRRRVSDFSGISLREPSGAALVEQLCGVNAQVHIDPSLLLNAEQWNKIAAAHNADEPYILLFAVPKPDQLVSYALRLAEQKNMRVIYLNNSWKKIRHPLLRYQDPVAPDLFLSMVRDAAYVCTNSFHGTAFSLLYHKPLVCETNIADGRRTRPGDLLTELSLQGRILYRDNPDPDIEAPVAWEQVDTALERQRSRSADYLKQCTRR